MTGHGTNPEIDRLLSEGSVSDALRQPWLPKPSREQRLRALVVQDGEGAREDGVYAGLTFGDVLYHAALIDPDVLRGVNFATRTGLKDVLTFAYFAQRHEELVDRSLSGNLSRFQGFVAERIVAHHLIEQGHAVTFPDGPTEPGVDMWVDGHPFQIKCLETIEGVHEHFRRYQIPVIMNADLAEHASDMPHVYVDAGLVHDDVRAATASSLEQGAEMGAFHPLIGAIASAPLPLYHWFKNDTDPLGVLTTVLTNTTGRTAVGFLGSKSAAAVGVILFGPAGFVVGGALGSILGAREGRRLAQAVRRLLTRSQEDALKECAVEVADRALASRPSKVRALKEKGESLLDSETSREGRVVQQFIHGRYSDGVRYLDHQADLLGRFAGEGRQMDPLDAWCRVLVLIKRAGIHPHHIQDGLSRLTDLTNDLVRARKRWLL